MPVRSLVWQPVPAGSGPWAVLMSPVLLAQRFGRYVLGVLGVFILWFGLGEVFPRGETWLPFLLRFLRYGLVGLWVTALAPLLFITHLAWPNPASQAIG